MEGLRNWNRRWNGLPRRAALLGGTLLAVAALGAALPYVWPFAAALLCAMLLATAVAIGVYTGLKMAAMMGGIAL